METVIAVYTVLFLATLALTVFDRVRAHIKRQNQLIKTAKSKAQLYACALTTPNPNKAGA